MKKKTIINSILVITTFLFSFYGKRVLNGFIQISFHPTYSNIIYSYLWWLIPTLFLMGYLFGLKNILNEIGIAKGFSTGLIVSIIAVSPMIISSAILGHLNSTINIFSLLHKTLIAGFMEEYLFRGFLFGLLFRKLRWGFIPAAVLGAAIFGIGHIYQGSSLMETTGVFFVTAFGAIWFAWLFIEWNENLWIPIFLHTFMNLSWVLFEVSENALGGLSANIFRIITIALTIIITIYYHKKRGVLIKKSNLIINSFILGDSVDKNE